MGGFVRKVTGAPNRKDIARITNPATSPVQAIKPKPEVTAPKVSDEPVQKAAEKELQRLSKQRGRAANILAVGDDEALSGGTAAKKLLGR